MRSWMLVVLLLAAVSSIAGCGDAPATTRYQASFPRAVGRLEVRWVGADTNPKRKEVGSAFLVGTGGHVVTAHHVADHGRSLRDIRRPEESARFVVVFPGSPAVDVTVVAEDRDVDLAALKLAEAISDIRTPRLLLAAPPAESAIVLAGYPIEEPDLVVRSGTLLSVTSLDPEPEPSWISHVLDGDLLLARVAARIGDSGGPVYLAETGEIIGLCSAALKTEPKHAPQVALVVSARRIASFLDAHGLPRS